MTDDSNKSDVGILVEENIGLIYLVLKRFKNRGRDMEELFQVGAEGLTKAAKRYNADLGYAFSTYAVPMIIGEIQRFIRDDGMVHISRKIKDDARKIAVVREQLEKSDNDEISIEKIEEKTGLSKQDIIIALDAGNPTTNIENEAVIDFIENQNGNLSSNSDKLVDYITLQEAMKELDENERRFIHIRYVEEKTQMQTAEILGKNQVAVSRYEKKILLKLRHICMI